ncbi:ribonuclease domain-containing protein [Nocardioides sp. SYSU D00065]|uniref:ribonuclease domain-containing protein n=1 Tax=Nocardioides sp. SYSU D00065 TaxID=2817378 RepID=UPI001B334FAE|nr:ribonuclease domain-containing protein [Nocardioides sp. SYSU D00065]
MSAGAEAARRRYRWLLVLIAATLLLGWLFAENGPDGTEPSGGSAATSWAPPTHQLTETTTPTTDPSTDPSTDPASGLPVVRVADLPAEARDVLRRIDRGGPFKYPDHDGGTFENREELLPDWPLGYYREYTVEIAPGVRGPRRIVAGDGRERYWTEDHYGSFSRIAIP